MNSWSGILDYKMFLIIIDSGCSFTIINEKKGLSINLMLTQSGVPRQEIIQLHLKSKYIYPHPNSA